METGGLTALFTRTMLAVEGSVLTVFHWMVLSLARSREDPIAGEVIWTAVH